MGHSASSRAALVFGPTGLCGSLMGSTSGQDDATIHLDVVEGRKILPYDMVHSCRIMISVRPFCASSSRCEHVQCVVSHHM